jgi:hypothetical protein
MRNAPTRTGSLQQRSRRSGDGLRWTVGIAIAGAAIGALLVAVACAPQSIRANNNLCLQQIANDEHTSLDAFFQNPAEQDAFVQAITICSRQVS